MTGYIVQQQQFVVGGAVRPTPNNPGAPTRFIYYCYTCQRYIPEKGCSCCQQQQHQHAPQLTYQPQQQQQHQQQHMPPPPPQHSGGCCCIN